MLCRVHRGTRWWVLEFRRHEVCSGLRATLELLRDSTQMMIVSKSSV